MLRRYAVKFFFLSYRTKIGWVSRMFISCLLFFIASSIAVLISGGTNDVTWYQALVPSISLLMVAIPNISLGYTAVRWTEMDNDQKYIFGSEYPDRLTDQQQYEWRRLLSKYV